MSRAVLQLTALFLLTACSGQPQGGPGASQSGSGVTGLISSLSAAGANARQAGTFDASPMQGPGVLLCLATEEVRVYVFPTEEARLTAARSIDQNDPSHVGTSIVEWTGNPRFWQRDSVLVLYLGTDPGTEALLTRVMGQPFARGTGGGLGGPRSRACASS